MNLERDCHEVEVTPNLESLVTFGMSSEGVCHEGVNFGSNMCGVIYEFFPITSF
jgi:hypothetical protein